MKIKYYINIIAFLYMIIFFQDNCYSACPEITNCPLKRHRYYICTFFTGNLIERCEYNLNSLNPNSEKAFKNNSVPVCLEYIENNLYPNTVLQPTWAGEKIVFNKDYLIYDDIPDAKFNWDCLCGWDNNKCQCTVEVKFTTSAADLGVQSQYLGSRIAAAVYAYNINYDCQISCNTTYIPKIYLNASTAFGTLMNGYRTQTFINQSYYAIYGPSYLDDIKDGYFAYNLTQIITHELGHILGLCHQNSNGAYCDPYNGVMDKGYYQNLPFFGMTNDDICMFKKLYCPNLTPVTEEKEDQFNNSIYPNPFKENATIKFYLDHNTSVSITIYNKLGEKVNSFENIYSQGENTEMFESKGLPSGIYYYTIRVGNTYNIGKMVLFK